MKISDIIAVENIVLLEGATSKRQLISNLTARASNITGIDSRTLFDIVLERENLGSTAFGGGSALPHGRIPLLNKIYGVFAKLDNGIDFDASDKAPVDLVFLLLSPENSGADHLTALAQVSKIIRDEESCKKLRAAKDAQEIYKILAE